MSFSVYLDLFQGSFWIKTNKQRKNQKQNIKIGV